MERVSTFQVGAGTASLRAAAESGTLSASLHEPMRALVQRVTRVAAERAVTLYLFADDASAESRDLFAYALARALRQHVPGALVVDCDFLAVGMHGVVPQRDALGFLDLLLYGSSIGVITQEAAGGVRVVGAGSFPVTKRMPFVIGAFEDASRRLAKHARCVIFVGPLQDDEGEPHPLIGCTDIPVLVRGEDEAPPSGYADGVEEDLVEHFHTELLSVRLTGRAPEPEPARAAPPPAAPTREAQPADAPARSAPPPREAPAPRAEPEVVPAPAVASDVRDVPAGPGEPRFNATLPRLLVGIFIVVVIASLAWWVYTERTTRARSPGAGTARESGSTARTQQSATPPPAATPAGTAADSTAAAPVETLAVAAAQRPAPAVADTVRSGAQSEGPPVPVMDPADTRGHTGGTVLIPSENILVFDDLTRDWTDWYVIHISSFKESVKARTEVAYLESREFPVFIVFLDLGAKGKWYRVYSGPFRERAEALEVKKNLDATPGVRFTRVSKVTP